MLKYALSVPFLIIVPTTAIGLKRRQEYLTEPVLERALMHIKNDQRVVDFCGDKIEPGWIIQRKRIPNENWVKYDLNVKGISGKLKTTVIGDFINHSELQIHEKERVDYQNLKNAQLASATKDATPTDLKSLNEEYMPVDFDSYSIIDQATRAKISETDDTQQIEASEPIWRISSLTAFVDNETKILLLPIPESKRTIKIQDTSYNLKSYKDLFSFSNQVQEDLQVGRRAVRFEDKTSDEIQEDIKKRRRTQIQQMNKIRTYQFGSMAFVGFGYIFVYRRFMHSKSVVNSAIYHQSIAFLKQNNLIQEKLGKHIQVMNCNGKISPIKSSVNFDLIIFGSNQKGKVKVQSEFHKTNNQWSIKHIDLFTKDQKVLII